MDSKALAAKPSVVRTPTPPKPKPPPAEKPAPKHTSTTDLTLQFLREKKPPSNTRFLHRTRSSATPASAPPLPVKVSAQQPSAPVRSSSKVRFNVDDDAEPLDGEFAESMGQAAGSPEMEAEEAAREQFEQPALPRKRGSDQLYDGSAEEDLVQRPPRKFVKIDRLSPDSSSPPPSREPVAVPAYRLSIHEPASSQASASAASDSGSSSGDHLLDQQEADMADDDFATAFDFNSVYDNLFR